MQLHYSVAFSFTSQLAGIKLAIFLGRLGPIYGLSPIF